MLEERSPGRTQPLPRFTDRVDLGASGLRVSPFCLGLVSDPRMIPSAFDAGINFFFVSADMHWPVYEGVRRGLALLFQRPGARDEAIVACVSYTTQPEFCSMPFQETVDAIPRLGRIDVLVAGGVYKWEFAARQKVYAAHKQRGWCGARAIGATFHERAAAREPINEAQVDIAYIRYNPRHPGGLMDLFPHLTAPKKVPVFNFNSTFGAVREQRFNELGLDDDTWMPALPDYYRFALTRPEIDGILFAPGTPAELIGAADALAEGPLSPEEEDHMLRLAEMDVRS
jgi:hypothetical protein